MSTNYPTLVSALSPNVYMRLANATDTGSGGFTWTGTDMAYAGVSMVDGDSNASAEFNGSSSFLASSFSAPGWTSLTVMALLRPDSVGVERTIAQSGSTEGWIFRLQNNTLQFWPNSNAGAATSAAITFSAGEIIFVAVTYDGTDVKFYFGNLTDGDPSLTLTNTVNLATAINNQAGMQIGRYQPAGWYYAGDMDEFAVWSGVISQANLETLYQDAKGAAPATPTSVDDAVVGGTVTITYSTDDTETSTTIQIHSDNTFLPIPDFEYVIPDEGSPVSEEYDLDPGTYYYRVKATNAHGDSAWSATGSFVISADVPALTVTGTASGGTYAFGATTSKTFTLTNTGGAALTISGINISGTGFSVITAPDEPIAPAGTAELTIARNATTGLVGHVDLISDDPLSPYVINFTGDAPAPAPSTAAPVLGGSAGMSTDITRPMSTDIT
jgi:hypothetical protein